MSKSNEKPASKPAKPAKPNLGEVKQALEARRADRKRKQPAPLVPVAQLEPMGADELKRLVGAVSVPVAIHGDLVVSKDSRDGATYGVHTGLELTKYIANMLLVNYDWELSDEQLGRVLKAEFPNRATFQSISQYRSYFNTDSGSCGIGQRLSKTPRASMAYPHKG